MQYISILLHKSKLGEKTTWPSKRTTRKLYICKRTKRESRKEKKKEADKQEVKLIYIYLYTCADEQKQ